MPNPRMKCEECNRRRKVFLDDYAKMREGAKAEGCRVGILCPDCVLKAYANEAAYTYSISDGEMMLDHLRDRPPWRMVYIPN